jgi:hypothetical protein
MKCVTTASTAAAAVRERVLGNHAEARGLEKQIPGVSRHGVADPVRAAARTRVIRRGMKMPDIPEFQTALEIALNKVVAERAMNFQQWVSWTRSPENGRNTIRHSASGDNDKNRGTPD